MLNAIVTEGKPLVNSVNWGKVITYSAVAWQIIVCSDSHSLTYCLGIQDIVSVSDFANRHCNRQ